MYIKIDQVDKSLLEDLAKASVLSMDGIHAAKFRAQHREHLDRLDGLQWGDYILRTGGNYRLTLLGLSEILGSVAELGPLLRRFEKIFEVLKRHYEAHYGEKITLDELSTAADLTREEVNIALTYMVHAPLFSTYTSNFYTSEGAYVTPSEGLLNYKSFGQCMEEMRARRSAHFQEANVIEASEDHSNDDIENFEFLLHPMIIEHALPQYRNGHLRDAVFNSIVAVFDLIRERTELERDGDALVETAFSLQRPRLILSELDSQSGKDEQKGFIQIFKGAYQGIRNPKAHSLSQDPTRFEAAQYLVFASLLARRVDEAKVIKIDEH